MSWFDQVRATTGSGGDGMSILQRGRTLSSRAQPATAAVPQQGESSYGAPPGAPTAEPAMPNTLANLGYAPGSALAPWTQQFSAPSAEDAINTPGLQYALDRAKQAIERSAAAKGTLLTGGTLRDLSENQIGMALQGYGDAYNRSRSEYDLSRSIFESNQDRPFEKLYRLGDLGRPV